MYLANLSATINRWRTRYVLSMTPSSHQLVPRICKSYRGVRHSLTNCAQTSELHHSSPNARMLECQSRLTLITSHLRANRIPHPTPRSQVRDYSASEHQQHARASCYHSPLRSVDTPVWKSPFDATANDPPRSTMQASVPPCRILSRF